MNDDTANMGGGRPEAPTDLAAWIAEKRADNSHEGFSLMMTTDVRRLLDAAEALAKSSTTPAAPKTRWPTNTLWTEPRPRSTRCEAAMSRPALVWRTSTTLPGMLIGERDGQNLYSVDNFRRRPVYRVCALAPWSLIDETTSLSAAKIACERHWQGGNHG